MKNAFCSLAPMAFILAPAQAARLDLALRDPPGSLPPGAIALDVFWTLQTSDTPTYDLDGFDIRFNVWYPPTSTGELWVAGVTALPGWSTDSTTGIGEFFWEGFFLSANDVSGRGISGNNSAFTILVASVILEVRGLVEGTQITFRHNDPADPVPSMHDGPLDWQLRWQEEVNGPFQFDIGAGNPGDEGPEWGPYHGYEAAAPVVFPPEPATLGLLLLGTLTLRRRV